MPPIPKPKPKAKPKVKKPTAYEAVNARKRYQREATRQLNLAESTTGETSARHRATARKMLDNALDTYSLKTKPKYTKEIRSLSERLNVDLSEVNMRRSQMGEAERELAEERRTRRIQTSDVLGVTKEGKPQTEATRSEAVARMMVTDSHITSRIIGGFEDVWKNDPTVMKDGKVDKRKIFKSIMKKLKVRTYRALLDKLEKISQALSGTDLYSTDDSEVIYETVKLSLQNYAMGEVVE